MFMNLSNFEELIKKKEITVVKLGADFCQPCKVLETKIDELAEKLPEVNFIKIDVEDEPEIATALRIRNVPVLLYYKDGELKDKTVGLVSDDTIIEKIEALKA